MIEVTISKMKLTLGRPEKIGEARLKCFIDKDINEFANDIYAELFKMSQDSDQIWIYYRYHSKTNDRNNIDSKQIRYQEKTIFQSRIVSDLNELLNQDE